MEVDLVEADLVEEDLVDLVDLENLVVGMDVANIIRSIIQDMMMTMMTLIFFAKCTEGNVLYLLNPNFDNKEKKLRKKE